MDYRIGDVVVLSSGDVGHIIEITKGCMNGDLYDIQFFIDGGTATYSKSAFGPYWWSREFKLGEKVMHVGGTCGIVVKESVKGVGCYVGFDDGAIGMFIGLRNLVHKNAVLPEKNEAKRFKTGEACKICRGTGRILMLNSYVDCECAASSTAMENK